METLLSIGIGIGLSAACGFRVFVPLLVLGIAGLTGQVTLADSFSWIGTPAAVTAFAVATALEIGAYYVPWLDNLLDTVASPAAVVAGIIVTASVVTELSPFLRWAFALIAGGGVAGLVQTATVGARFASSVTTAGFGNPLVATVETGGAALASILAIVLPLLSLLLVVLLVLGLHRQRRRN